MIATIEQCRQGFNESSATDVVEHMETLSFWIECSTLVLHNDVESFNSLRDLKYDGNMLTPEERSVFILGLH